MATMLTMPKLGLTMTEGSIQEWKKNEGDPVKKGEVILSVATDKLTYEVEAPEDGVLLAIAVPAGETVPVGAVIGAIGEAGEPFEFPGRGGPGKETAPSPEPGESGPETAGKPVSPHSEKEGKKVAVIGGGPGGYIAAIRAAQLGSQVILAEKNKLGGTCVNVGCIPTKALLHAAGLLDDIRAGLELGIMADSPKVDWDKVQERKNQVVEQLSAGVQGLLAANGVKVVKGNASFVDDRTVEVVSEAGTDRITADAFIIATGSAPSVPPIPGNDLEGVVTSTEALSFAEIPPALAIIGGGVIGVEMASIYASFGSRVTVFEMLPRILPGADAEVVGLLAKILESRGVVIHTAAEVKGIEKAGSGLSVKAVVSGEPTVVEADKVLVAAGRSPFTESLNPEAAGIKVKKGRIVVDEYMRTNREHIYAVGDCCSPVMLAHVAMKEGRIAAENALSRSAKKMDYRTNPGCVYTSPELAWVGLTEEDAKKQGYSVLTGKFPLIGNAKSLISGETRGMVKVVAEEKYGEILGGHIVGFRATDLIAEASLAVGLEATLEEVAQTIHGHPTFGEALCEAALAALGESLHMPPA
jgi:dihydrolipoamide dehydrogenase